MTTTGHAHPNDGSTFVVEPLHLQVTQTHVTGAVSALYIQEDGDLSIEGEATRTIRAAQDGALLISLSVDGAHDDVRYTAEPTGGETHGSVEMLTRGIEVLTLALAAVKTSVS